MSNASIHSIYRELGKEKSVEFSPTPSDPGHVIVRRFLPGQGKEILGHIYVEVDGEETRFLATNRSGREIFPATTDFNLLETKFERYARLLDIMQDRNNYQQLIHEYNLTFKNPNPMTTQKSKQPPKMYKDNQLRFIEYERATNDGHFLTIADSYHNVIGRVHKSFNDETKKYEYVAYDHAGNIYSKNDRLWDVKKEFINNREQLLEQAHQRRIESKQPSKTIVAENLPAKQPAKVHNRQNEMANLRGEKPIRGRQVETPGERSAERTEARASESGSYSKANNKHSKHQEREDELNDLRDSQDEDRDDRDIDF